MAQLQRQEPHDDAFGDTHTRETQVSSHRSDGGPRRLPRPTETQVVVADPVRVQRRAALVNWSKAMKTTAFNIQFSANAQAGFGE